MVNALRSSSPTRSPGESRPANPKRLPFVELEENATARNEVKREKPILVILGNPPYNSFAGIARIEEERD